MKVKLKHLFVLMAFAGIVCGVAVFSYDLGKKAGRESLFDGVQTTFPFGETTTRRSSPELLEELLDTVNKNYQVP